jgi:hypothetical protein
MGNQHQSRKDYRRPFRRASGTNAAPRPCMIEEISNSDAKITFERYASGEGPG